MVAISDLQRRLIPYIQVDAKLGAESIARALRTKAWTVRYQTRMLVEKGILRLAPFLNPYPLGLQYVNLYFSIGSVRSSELEELIKVLVKSPQISWLAEFGGDYHFGLSLLVRHVHEVRDFLDSLAQHYQALFFEKAMVFHTGLTNFPARYLGASARPGAHVGYGPTGRLFQADEIDLKILLAMSSKWLTSGRAIAREIGAPPTTVDTRMRILERERVIAGYWYVYDASKLGYQTFKLLVYAKGHASSLSQKLFEFSARHPNITFFIESLGAWDFEIGVDVQRFEECPPIVRTLLDRFSPHVNTIKILPMFRILKIQQFTESGLPPPS